jgi:hypothetical protein
MRPRHLPTNNYSVTSSFAPSCFASLYILTAASNSYAAAVTFSAVVTLSFAVISTFITTYGTTKSLDFQIAFIFITCSF